MSLRDIPQLRPFFLLFLLSLLSSKIIRRFFVFIKNCLLKNQGRHGIIPGNDTRNDGIIPGNLHGKEKIRVFAFVVTPSWYIDFSFECSIVVRPASCLRGSPWRQCQPLDIYQAMLSNSFWIHCSSKWCQQNVSRCREWRIFDLALHYCSPMESMVLSWWEFEERANGSKDEHDDNRNFVSKSPLSSTT